MIDAHRGAFEYDWRARFRLPLDAIGGRMSWGEAWRLLQILIKDPSSQVAAAVSGWDGPRSREWVVLADLYDLTHKGLAGKKKTTPYPRPWNAPKRRGRTAMSRDEVIAVLNRFGHDIPN